MKPSIDRDLCIGCGMCEDVCPEVFRLDEDAIATVICETVTAELYGCTRDAFEACPVDAIALEE